MRESWRPVAALHDGLALNLITKNAFTSRAKGAYGQPPDEVGNGLVKVTLFSQSVSSAR